MPDPQSPKAAPAVLARAVSDHITSQQYPVYVGIVIAEKSGGFVVQDVNILYRERKMDGSALIQDDTARGGMPIAAEDPDAAEVVAAVNALLAAKFAEKLEKHIGLVAERAKPISDAEPVAALAD